MMRILTFLMLIIAFSACKKEFVNPDVVPPTLSLDSLVGPSYNAGTNNISVRAFAQVVRLGNTLLIERGFIFDDTLAEPTLDDNDRISKLSTVGPGPFDAIIAGLPPARTVYFRAYARYFKGVAYSNVRTVTTPESRPVLTANRPESNQITSTTAQLSGVLVFTGGQPVTEMGFVIGTATNPTIETATKINVPVSGEGTAFSATATDLQPGTNYFVRAFAVNALGINYTPQVTFTTKN